MKRAADAATSSRGAGFEQLDERAADHDGVGDLGHRPRRRGVADAEADADRQLHVALIRGIVLGTAAMSRWPAPVTPLSDTW